MQGLDWIAVDWGATRVRAWALDGAGRVLAKRSADATRASLAPDAFEPALIALVEDLLPAEGTIPVLCSGATGAGDGWAAAPAVAVPAPPPSAAQAVAVPVRDPRLDVRLLPGMRQGKPADLMRGEETRVAGVLAARPGFDGVLCLPGAHTKWVHVSAGEIVSFTTFMTGELFALLTRPSALRHGLGTEGWDEAVFLEAVADAMGRPQGIGAALFGVDAACVLGQTSPETARARLSGLLVGLELAGARPHWLGQEVRIVGTGDLARAYGVALRAQAASVGPLEDDDFALRGLCAARGGAPFTTGASPAT